MENQETTNRDYMNYCIGEDGPIRGTKIKDIIDRTSDYIIYIDRKNNILRSSTKDNIFEEFGQIRNDVSELGSMVNRIFVNNDVYQFKISLATILARLVSDKNEQVAKDALKSIKESISRQGFQTLKQAYIYSTIISTTIVIIFILSILLLKSDVIYLLGKTNYEILLVSLFGGIGSFIFTNLRIKSYQSDINLNRKTHVLDGALRIFFGVISGLFIILGIKANLIFGFINKFEMNFFAEAFMCTVAGASDIIIPNIIKQVERNSDSGLKSN